MDPSNRPRRRRRGRRDEARAAPAARSVDYRHLTSEFPLARGYSDDRIGEIHAGALTGGANIVIHAAGWLEGGLSASYEKFILDIEPLRHVAELMQPVRWDDGELALDALREVGSGGHFFGAAHTLERYRTAYYAPFVSDWSNFGQWEEAGGRTATERAHNLWRQVLADFRPPDVDPGVVEAIDAFVARRTEEGGADPVS